MGIPYSGPLFYFSKPEDSSFSEPLLPQLGQRKMGGKGGKKEGREREADDGGSVKLSHFPHGA